MSNGILRPSAIGGTISAFDSDSLAGMDPSGLPVGTKVWNVAVGSFFILTVSTASLVTDSVLAVLGIVGYRWIIVSSNAATADAPTDATTFTADLNVATTALKGLESAADKIAIGGIMFDEWCGVRRQEMLVAVPELTEFLPLDFSHFPAATAAAPTFDASVEGGGVWPGASASVLFITRGLAQSVKTGKGALVLRAQFPTAPSIGESAQLGLCNAAESHYVLVRRKDTATEPNYVLEVVGGATTSLVGTIASNNNWHNIMFAWNGTNVRLYIDNAIAATAALTNAFDESMFAYLFNTEANKVRVSKGFYGYIPV
jgi:hypothetical protein